MVLKKSRMLQLLGLVGLLSLLAFEGGCSSKGDSKQDPPKKPRVPRPISASLDEGTLNADDLETAGSDTKLDDPLIEPPLPPAKDGEDIEKFEKVDTPTGEPGGKPGDQPPPPPDGSGKPDKAEVKINPEQVQTPQNVQEEWEFDDYCKVAYDKAFQELIKEEEFIKKGKPEELFDAWLFEIKKTVDVIEAVIRRDHGDIPGVKELVVTTAADCAAFFNIVKDVEQINMTGGANGGDIIAENPDGIMLPDPLAGLPNLISVNLDHNRLMSTRGVRRLPNLKHLFASYNYIETVGVEGFFFTAQVDPNDKKAPKGTFYEKLDGIIKADPADDTHRTPFGVLALETFGIGHQAKLDYNEEEGTTTVIFDEENPPVVDLKGLMSKWNPFYYRSLNLVTLLQNRVDPNVFRGMQNTIRIDGGDLALDFDKYTSDACNKTLKPDYPTSLLPLVGIRCKYWCSSSPKGPGCK